MATLKVIDQVVGEADGFVDIVVQLSRGAGENQTVTVDYATQVVTAGSFDYFGVSGSLTFEAGETAQTVRVQLDDRAGEEDLEHFRFNLSEAVNATISQASAMISIFDSSTVVSTPNLFVHDVVVDEKAGTATFVVWLDAASNSTVTVNYATQNPASGPVAVDGEDYEGASGQLTFDPGQTVRTVVVNLTDDVDAEGIERFDLNLSGAVNATLMDNQAQATISLSDGPNASQPRLSVADRVVGESEGYIDVVVSMSAPSTNAVSVDYTTQVVTAGSFDYIGVEGTLRFAAGETSKTVRIELDERAGVEDLEHFRFNLSDATNASIANASAMITFVDDDTIVETPGLFVRDIVVDEKAGTASFVVWLDGASNSTVSVDYATGNASATATATAGSDYAQRAGTLTFAAGETAKTVVVDLVDDRTAEGFERFNLNLSGAVNATLMDNQAQATIGLSDGRLASQPRLSVTDRVIGESDGYIDVVVSMSAPSANAVSVDYATQVVTAGSFDYLGVEGTLRFAAGETTKTVRIELDERAGIEDLEHFRFNLSDATNASIANASAMITIVDDDDVVDTPSLFVRDVVVDEKAGTASFVVWLEGASNSTVSVDYATGRAGATTTAKAGDDFLTRSGSLTFAAGETAKTVVVDLVDDARSEGAERFAITLRNASNATIVDANAIAQIGASDGKAASQPKIVFADQTVSEADGFFDLVVSLSAPSSKAVSVAYTTDAHTAGSFDFIGTSGTLQFAAGETTKVIRIELDERAAAESLEQFFVEFSSATNATLADTQATITILDDDNGAKVMSYGISDDVYRVNAATDVIVENRGGGYDIARSSVSYRLGDNVDELVLLGSAATGTGNALANRLVGNARANTLDGGKGNDTMIGGNGNDRYVVNSSKDVVIETNAAASQIDTVLASAGFKLGSNVENLTLTGGGAVNGTGNALANRLIGNNAANVLDGGAGKDTLSGGKGDDAFRFTTLSTGADNADRITDFSSADDRFVFENATFTRVGAAGKLASSAFRLADEARDASDRVVYDRDSGQLFYDADGSGRGAQVLVASLGAGTSVSIDDLWIS